MYPLQTIWFLVKEYMCITTTTGFGGIPKGSSLQFRPGNLVQSKRHMVEVQLLYLLVPCSPDF